MASLDLGKQVGPLPLGAWVVVVAGGLGIAWYTKRSGTASTSTTDTSTNGIPTDQTGVGDGSVGGWTSTTPTDTTSTTSGAPTTNDEWFQKAETELIARNYDPNLVDSALRKYLSGANDLSVSEYTLIGLALTLVGPLPSPLPATGQNPPTNNPPAGGTTPPTGGTGTPHKPPPPPPKPKPKPSPHYRYYTVVRGDNLWNISTRYYGTGTKYGSIYNANRYGKKRADGKVGMIKNPALIQPGWVLLIP